MLIETKSRKMLCIVVIYKNNKHGKADVKKSHLSDFRAKNVYYFDQYLLGLRCPGEL